MKTVSSFLIAIIAVILAVILYTATYTVGEYEQVILTQFGKPIGEPVKDAGLHFKLPVVQEVNRIDKRILEYDGQPNEMPTKDKLYISVDTFGRWQIEQPLLYFQRLRDERSAQSRLEDILGSETRNAVAKHELIEIIRTTKGRTPIKDEALEAVENTISDLRPIMKGRTKIEQDIVDNSVNKLAEFGIRLLDVRFKRINYNEQVREKIYERMISERNLVADRFRSEGEGEAAKIAGNKERDLKTIESEAYKTIQSVKGDADAKATEIYAKAYNQSSQSAEFYEFTKTLETYKKMIGKDTTLILSTDSDIFHFLKGIDGKSKKPSSQPVFE